MGLWKALGSSLRDNLYKRVGVGKKSDMCQASLPCGNPGFWMVLHLLASVSLASCEKRPGDSFLENFFQELLKSSSDSTKH